MKIFIVEDDPVYAQMMEYHLSKNPDDEIESFSSGKELISNLFKTPELIAMDYSLGDMKGNELVKTIKSKLPDVPVIVISSQKEIKTAVDLLKEGAYDYIVKDDDALNRLWISVNNARELTNLKEEISQLREEVHQKYDAGKIMAGESPQIKKVFALIEKGGKTNINIGITGETGTGKELVAKAVHYNSTRSKKPFVAVNTAAIPSELLESELFGFEKGAFTGAAAKRIGKFEAAHQGTLFLDEIGELDMNLQAKLLRVLQESEVERLGGTKPIKIDVRIITATHKDLASLVKEGKFREDLYYRLIGLPIHLPPLRERGHDILILAQKFLNEFATSNKMGKLEINEAARQKMLNYPFPGNVRELKATMELAAVMCADGVVNETDITFRAVDAKQQLLSQEKTLKEYTSDIIHHFLEKYDNNVVRVAEKLGVGKSTIYQMLKEEKQQQEV